MAFSPCQSTLPTLELRLAQIRTALTELTDIQAQLQRNASDSKSDIQTNFSRQLESLRTREVYLLSQVDTLLQVKQDHLQLQAEGLQRELGCLEVLLDCAKTEGRAVALQDVEDIMKRFQQLQLSPEEDAALGFEGDSKQLKKAILSFGYVNPKRQRLTKDEDAETMSGQIIGAFEQFAGHQVWLCKAKQSGNGSKDCSPSMVYPIFLEKGDSTQWLLREGSQCGSPMESSPSCSDDEDSFVVVPEDPQKMSRAFSTHFASILSSPDIQWVRPTPKTAAPVGVSPHQLRKPYSFYRPSGTTKDWVRKPAAEGQDQQMDTHNANICSPSQMPAKLKTPIEIEDLADMVCVQDAPSGASSPCSPKTSPTPKNQPKDEKVKTCCSSPAVNQPSAKTNINEVCKGNETCKTFDECLCDDNCGDATKRGNVFSGIPESSKNQWLIRTPPAAEKGGKSEGNQAPTTPDEEMPKADYVQEWLVSKTTSAAEMETAIVSSFLKWQLEENPSWVQKSSSGRSPLQLKQRDTSPVNEWLLKKAEASSLDNKKSCEDQTVQSGWLLPRSPPSCIPAFSGPRFDTTSWLLKEKGQKSVADSKEDDVPEKWLLKKAAGVPGLASKPHGFPYFSVPMDVNQWLKE